MIHTQMLPVRPSPQRVNIENITYRRRVGAACSISLVTVLVVLAIWSLSSRQALGDSHDHHHHHDHDGHEHHEGCPFHDHDHDHHDHDHHHHDHEHDDRGDGYLAEMTDAQGRKKYVALAYKKKGVLLLTRLNFRSVMESLLITGHNSGNNGDRDQSPTDATSSPTPSSSASASLVFATPPVVKAMIVLFYNPEAPFTEDVHKRFVAVAEDYEIMKQQSEIEEGSGSASTASTGSSTPKSSVKSTYNNKGQPSAQPMLLAEQARKQRDQQGGASGDDYSAHDHAPLRSKVILAFGQINVADLKPLENEHHAEQEAQELQKTGGSVRDFLFQMRHARRVVDDTPSIGIFLETVGSTDASTSSVSLYPYHGALGLAGIGRFLFDSCASTQQVVNASIGGALPNTLRKMWGVASVKECQRMAQEWPHTLGIDIFDLPAAGHPPTGTDGGDASATPATPSTPLNAIPVFEDGVLVV